MHIIGSMQVGGAETMLYRLIDREKDVYRNIYLVSLTELGYYGDLLRKKGVVVYELGIKKSFLSVLKFIKLRRIIKNNSPDIIHAWMYHSSLVTVLMKKLFRLKFFLVWNIRHCLHDIKSEKKTTRCAIALCDYFSKYTDKIIYNSEQSQRQHRQYGFKENEKSLIVYNGFDAEYYQHLKDSRVMLAAQLEVPIESKFIGLIGRYHPIKGVDVFLDAVKQVCMSRDDVVVLMIGSGMDESNLDLAEKIKPRELTSKVHLLGQRSNINFYMSCLDVLVNSSYSESFSNVIAEALLCEAHCVATNVGDSKTILGEQGILVESGDSAAIVKGVLSFLSMEQMQSQAISRSARNRIKQQFSIDAVIDHYRNVNLNLMKSLA